MLNKNLKNQLGFNNRAGFYFVAKNWLQDLDSELSASGFECCGNGYNFTVYNLDANIEFVAVVSYHRPSNIHAPTTFLCQHLG